MLAILSISDSECDGYIPGKTIETKSGKESKEFTITPQDDGKFSIWVGIGIQLKGEEMDYVKGWHYDDLPTMGAAIQKVMDEET